MDDLGEFFGIWKVKNDKKDDSITKNRKESTNHKNSALSVTELQGALSCDLTYRKKGIYSTLILFSHPMKAKYSHRIQIGTELDKLALPPEKKLQVQTDVIVDINILAKDTWKEIELIMGTIKTEGPNEPTMEQQVFLTSDDVLVSLRYSKAYSPGVQHHQVTWGVVELFSNQTPIEVGELAAKLKGRMAALGAQSLADADRKATD